MALKSPSITSCINIHPNQGDACLKTDTDSTSDINVMSFEFTNAWANPYFSASGTSDITKHDELRIH
jgi:hypothetical protein